MAHKNYKDAIRGNFYNFIESRKLSKSNIYITNHFVERYHTRNIKPKVMYGCLNKLCSNICSVLYHLELGKTPPVITYKDITIRYGYDRDNKRLILKTCY